LRNKVPLPSRQAKNPHFVIDPEKRLEAYFSGLEIDPNEATWGFLGNGYPDAPNVWIIYLQ